MSYPPVSLGICLSFMVICGSGTEAFSQEQSHSSPGNHVIESEATKTQPLSPRVETAILAMLDVLENEENDRWEAWAAFSLPRLFLYWADDTAPEYTTHNDEIAKRLIRLLQKSDNSDRKIALCESLTYYRGTNIDIFPPILYVCLDDETIPDYELPHQLDIVFAITERLDHRQREKVVNALCPKIQDSSESARGRMKMIEILGVAGITNEQTTQALVAELDDRNRFSCLDSKLARIPPCYPRPPTMSLGFPNPVCGIASMCAKALADLQVKDDDIYVQIQGLLDRKGLTRIDQAVLHCSLALLRPTEENLASLKSIYQRDLSASRDADGWRDYSSSFVIGVVHVTLRQLGTKAKSFVPLINADIQFCEKLKKNNGEDSSLESSQAIDLRIEFLEETLRAINSSR